MSSKLFIVIIATIALAPSLAAQNTNTTPRAATPRTQATPRKSATAASAPAAAEDEPTPSQAVDAPRTRSRRAGASVSAAGQTRAAALDPSAAAVRNVFDTLIRNIERSDVDAVMSLYWNSPQLVIFNNNGTVTRGWGQVRSNRASSYPEAKDVKIEARDVRVQTLGRDGAIVTCLWRQSQEFRSVPEASAGRLTVVFRLINNGWKIVHTHSSPEAPDPSRLMPSEQTTPPARTTATPPPGR